MTNPLEMPIDKLNAILNNGRLETPLHTVITLDDRRMNPFMSMEDFEKKWNIVNPEKESL